MLYIIYYKQYNTLHLDLFINPKYFLYICIYIRIFVIYNLFGSMAKNEPTVNFEKNISFFHINKCPLKTFFTGNAPSRSIFVRFCCVRPHFFQKFFSYSEKNWGGWG